MFDPHNPFVCLYEGYVVDNEDPLRIGRVKVNVPGLLEPSSDWALPLGNPGAGSDGRGFWCVPAMGSNVCVFFREGDLEHIRYFAGAWAAPDSEPKSPTFAREGTAADAAKITGIQTDQWNIVCDDRLPNPALRIESRAIPANTVTIDQQSVTVSGAVAVQIKSTGVVNIEALQVVINGRVVLPTGKPI